MIYQRRTSQGIWLLTLAPAIAAMAAAAEDQNWSAGLMASLVAALLLAATLWIAIGWSGRTRLAEVWRDGDDLILRQGHILNRGAVRRVPMSEIRNWRAQLEHYDRHQLEVATFDHAGVTYTLQIQGAQHADLDWLNAWIERDRIDNSDRAV